MDECGHLERPVAATLLSNVLWRRMDIVSLEHFRLTELPGMLALQGLVIATLDSSPLQVNYLVYCNPDWTTRHVHVTQIRGGEQQNLELRRDESGRWWKVDTALPEFDGITDIDVQLSPSTNTLPIRRLGIGVGESVEVEALWIRFPGLTLERLPQRYTRTGERRYTYESAGGSFTADLETDDDGVVVRYGQLWERVGA